MKAKLAIEAIKRQPLLYLALFVGLLALAFNLYAEYFIESYRHDALYYMPFQKTYLLDKLHGEGRWAIYLLFNLLKATPGFVAVVVALVSFGYFSYIVARRLGYSGAYALLIALLMVQIPSHYSQLLWPATSYSSFIFVALAAFLVSRLNRWLFFALMGLLFFGGLMQFYYLMPLLFIKEAKGLSLKELFKKIIAPWAGGYLVGYLCSLAVVYGYFHSGFELAIWRHPSPVNSFAQLIENIVHTKENLLSAIGFLNYNPLATVVLLGAIAFGLYNLYLKRQLSALLLLVAVVLTHFILTTYYGIDVDARTHVFFYSGIWFMALVYHQDNRVSRLLFPLGMILFILTYGYKNYHTIKWFSTITNVFKQELLNASFAPPKLLSGVMIVDIDKHPFAKTIAKIEKHYHLQHQKDLEYLASFKRWAPPAFAAGYRGVSGCTKKYFMTAYYQVDTDVVTLCKYSQSIKPLNPKSNNLYLTYPITWNRQIVTLNPNWDPSKPSHPVPKLKPKRKKR